MKTYAANGTPKPASPDNPYFPDPGLVDAVNAALILRKPLLVSGEPGSGKTQLAYSVAADLGLGEPLRFDTKSISEARHLFYHYDAIAHFRSAQIKDRSADPDAEPSEDDRLGSMGAFPHVEIQALGKAIALANAPTPEIQRLVRAREPWAPLRSVVLIDEIDKAPRDFPNDLLNELENFSFQIPELGDFPEIAIAPDQPELRPVVIHFQ